MITTRLLFWKVQWKSVLFWSFFPLIMTVSLIIMTDSAQEDTKIPVGIVLEDDHILVEQLYQSIANTKYIRSFLLDEREALNKLEKHELDSVFIVRKNYAENIKKGRRDHLVTAYQSDLSFAYVPLKELVISYVYEDFIRSQAAFAVRELQLTYNRFDQFNWSDLVEQTKQIEQEQNLLQTHLIFNEKETTPTTQSNLLDPWAVWVVITFLATFLLFDWTIKENDASIKQRFLFGRYNFKQYLTINTLFYTVGLLFIDLLTILILSNTFKMSLSISLFVTIISYRLTLNLFALLISLLFRSTYFYYIVVFILFFIVLISSNIIIPMDGVIAKFPIFIYLNPLQPILLIDMFNFWLFIACGLFLLWFKKKEKQDA